jgi:hypothetical protein
MVKLFVLNVLPLFRMKILRTGMPESLATLTVDGVISVYTSGFLLTVTAWFMGMKIGVAIGVIRKL